ncbi:MAG: DNA mismatch endonuclease Vsr [Gemmatimonadales bacterium]|nr:DNA mismatch endonuclease Vsr [Gemmatimonadales bacterium]
MADTVDHATRSRLMGRIRSLGTLPERQVRSLLHREGLRFRLNVEDMPGRPDIVLKRWRTVVFVHGCFWHRHRGCRLSYTPKTRVVFWKQKFAENTARDGRVAAQLRRRGWSVRVVWACSITPARIRRLASAIRGTAA